MSYDDDRGHRIWVSDLDDYIDLDSISDEYEDGTFFDASDDSGEIALFSGKTIASSKLVDRGVTPDRWRWMLHGAKASLGSARGSSEIEATFLKAIITIGRRHGVARYARLENLTYSSAITATLPYGIRALLYQYIATEPSLAGASQRRKIQEVFQCAVAANRASAYDRTGVVRQGLHEQAIAAAGPQGHLGLDTNGMREILSLCRLHFSILECDFKSIHDLRDFIQMYRQARKAAIHERNHGQVASGSYIRKWRARHLHPLPFYFPYSIRSSLDRAIRHVTEIGRPLDRSAAENELALARCGVALMRQSAKMRNIRGDAKDE